MWCFLVDLPQKIRKAQPEKLRSAGEGNQGKLLNLVLDREFYEKHTINVPAAAGGSLPIFAGYRGPNETLIALINEILAAMLRTTDPTMSKARIGIGRKGNRELSVFCTRQGQAEEVVAPELSQLSSGQLMALGLATEIIRAHELLSGSTPSSLDDVRGIAVVDEIDLHLHIAFQKLVLPTLIRKLPRVQFLVTTHSPFFLLRMSETGDVDIYSLPIRKR